MLFNSTDTLPTAFFLPQQYHNCINLWAPSSWGGPLPSPSLLMAELRFLFHEAFPVPLSLPDCSTRCCHSKLSSIPVVKVWAEVPPANKSKNKITREGWELLEVHTASQMLKDKIALQREAQTSTEMSSKVRTGVREQARQAPNPHFSGQQHCGSFISLMW